MGRIDAHCHFWAPQRGDYGWLEAGGAELEPLRRTFAPSEVEAINQGASMIAVQATDTVAETKFLLSLADAHARIAAVTGWVDLTSSQAIADLDELTRHSKFKAIRPMLQDLAADDWLLTKPLKANIQAVFDHGLRFEALVRPQHLPYLRQFADLWPELPIVIDHCAKPVMGGATPIEPDWQQGICALAASGQVWCKFSGLLTELPTHLRGPDQACAALAPVLACVLDAFGPQRVMWGSDWPVLTLAASYNHWEEITCRLLRDLTEAERSNILGNNAAQFYGLEVADG